jgi:hypothetical protein
MWKLGNFALLKCADFADFLDSNDYFWFAGIADADYGRGNVIVLR